MKPELYASSNQTMSPTKVNGTMVRQSDCVENSWKKSMEVDIAKPSHVTIIALLIIYPRK
jgi:hypothetical protein